MHRSPQPLAAKAIVTHTPVSPNREARRKPGFRYAVEQLEAYVLPRMVFPDSPLDWVGMCRQVLERLAHGLPQRVSTEHVLQRLKRRRIRGGRDWVESPSYGSVVRLLELLVADGTLAPWVRCEYDRTKGRSPARCLRLTGQAGEIVRAALRADWIPAVPGFRGFAVSSSVVPRIQSAMGADPPAAERPPGDDGGSVLRRLAGAAGVGWLFDRA